MSPEQKLKYMILAAHANLSDGEVYDHRAVSGAEIDQAYEQLAENGDHWDAMGEVRGGQVETNLPCPFSRHLEAKGVAAQFADGSWVGWTYWYGGGKHANPEEIDWVCHAYDLTCKEEEKVVTVRTFALTNGGTP
jgi:hypothetical protein